MSLAQLTPPPAFDPRARTRPDLCFDPTALREELSLLAKSHDGNAVALRAAVLDRLKPLVAQNREVARAELAETGSGRACAARLARFQDALLELIHDFAIYHVYHAKNPTSAEKMAFVATGGYGRGLLAPFSDIDLLFLLPYKQTSWGESIIEFMLYMLWDLGFKVGHATRTVDQTVKFARQDVTTRTALLDARLLWGNAPLFAEFQTRFWREVVRGSGREFVEAKLAERDERHKRAGASRYLVEPNVKDGKGGLRDLHTLHWLARYLSDTAPQQNGVEAAFFQVDEYHTYHKCEDFLWKVRCALHFTAGRAEERLSFDLQPELARQLGYTQVSGMLQVERFMRHYFLVARQVGALTRTLCAVLEDKQLKEAPKLNGILSPLTWRRRVELKRISDFRIENGRITFEDHDIFRRDPVNIVRLFYHADKYNASIHPEILRLLRGSLRHINDDLRSDAEAGRLFMELLTSRNNAANVLRSMNEAGVLGRFLPEFGRIVALAQFNMYHHFTVDEHLIRSIAQLSDIEHGRFADQLPLSTKIIANIQNRRALYLATLLHDAGKGREEDHSIVGARLARSAGPRLGLSKAETETVAWLIENHLVMSQIAQSRDLNDPKTIRDFADIVQSRERLKMLLVLTVADIRAVGPGVWNGWKGQLLRTLYYETEPLLAGGHTAKPRSERVAMAKRALADALATWPEAARDKLLTQHTNPYWLRTDADKQKADAHLLRTADEAGTAVATAITTDPFTQVSAITVLAPNHPRLLAEIAGACAAANANIVDAQIFTTTDNRALDTISLTRECADADDEKRRVTRIAANIEKVVSAQASLQSLMEKKRSNNARVRAFTKTIEAEVTIDNDLSDQLTVIEVSGLDRPGLLYELTTALSDLGLDIGSAHIATFGERAVDVFYVTDLGGKKIANGEQIKTITDRLMAVLQVSSAEALVPAGA